MNKTRFTWFVEVPERLFLELENFMKKSEFKTKSELIRCAVRDKIKN